MTILAMVCVIIDLRIDIDLSGHNTNDEQDSVRASHWCVGHKVDARIDKDIGGNQNYDVQGLD